jgi:hypothetical protein
VVLRLSRHNAGKQGIVPDGSCTISLHLDGGRLRDDSMVDKRRRRSPPSHWELLLLRKLTETVGSVLLFFGFFKFIFLVNNTHNFQCVYVTLENWMYKKNLSDNRKKAKKKC